MNVTQLHTHKTALRGTSHLHWAPDPSAPGPVWAGGGGERGRGRVGMIARPTRRDGPEGDAWPPETAPDRRETTVRGLDASPPHEAKRCLGGPRGFGPESRASVLKGDVMCVRWVGGGGGRSPGSGGPRGRRPAWGRYCRRCAAATPGARGGGRDGKGGGGRLPTDQP